ncbi:hypothetical protein P2318_21415 [Myxococcaceae bacterium GXIMD 01537]
MSLHERQPRLRRRPRLLAWPLMVLCTLAYLGSAAHFALVRHALCLEHGESIHLDEGQGGPVALERSFEDARVTGTNEVATPGHGSDAHCAHTFLRREALPPPGGVLLVAGPPSVSAPLPLAQELLPEPVSRLRLAPKSSPPSV